MPTLSLNNLITRCPVPKPRVNLDIPRHMIKRKNQNRQRQQLDWQKQALERIKREKQRQLKHPETDSPVLDGDEISDRFISKLEQMDSEVDPIELSE